MGERFFAPDAAQSLRHRMHGMPLALTDESFFAMTVGHCPTRDCTPSLRAPIAWKATASWGQLDPHILCLKASLWGRSGT